MDGTDRSYVEERVSPTVGGAGAKRGVYFMANDAILDIAIAFLNSFRISNPTIPLCLIPFSDNIRELTRISRTYGYSIFDDEDLLRRCDEISLRFFGQCRGHFRKLCAFHGSFEEFIYIDSDTVVLRDISFAYQFGDYFDFVFSHSNTPGLRQWVWKESIYDQGVLSDEQISFSANTGFFLSRRGAIDVSDAERDIEASVSLAPHMELRCVEQPYLNYLVVTSGRRYTSLLSLRCASRHWNIPLEKWAGGGFWSSTKDSVKHEGGEFFLYHWAGQWAASDFDKRLYRWLEKLGFKIQSPTVKLLMPRKQLWRRYRNYQFEDVTSILHASEGQRT